MALFLQKRSFQAPKSDAASHHQRILPIAALLFAIFAFVQPLVSQTTASTETTTGEFSLPKAAPHVKLRLMETISSASASVGQPVAFEVVEPVEVDGKIIVAAGAQAKASVTQVRRRGRNRREGKLLLTIQSVSLVDGHEASLQSTALKMGSGQGMPIFGPCTFPIPADPVGLFRKGDDVVIPKGTELIAMIAPLPH